MLIWSGRGYLVPLGSFLIALVAEWVTESLVGDEQYYQHAAWPLALVLSAAAVLAYTVGKRLNGATQPSHTFFFVRMEHWGPILAALAAASFLARSLR